MKKTLLAMLLCGSMAWAQEKSIEQLMADLKAMDPAVRASAVMDLGLRGGEKVVPLLLERLSKDPADSVRAAAISSFEMMAIGLRREALFKQIAQGLEGALDGPARMGALRLLLTSFSKFTSQPRANLMNALLGALKSDDEEIRSGAIETILREFRYHPRLAEAVLAAWKARPADTGLLGALVEMSSVHRHVREALQATMLERLVSQDVDLVTSATGYFATANNAWKVRQELSGKLTSPNSILRLQSCLAFSETFGDSQPLIEATRLALTQSDSETRGVAARVLLTRPEVERALPGALEKLSRDQELGTAVLAELLAANQLPASRVGEVRKLLSGPEGVSLASLLPRWSEGRKLAPELEKMANRAADEEALGLCRALLELGEVPTALPRLRKLARSKSADVAEGAMRTLAEYPQVGSRELLELAKVNKVNLGQTLLQRPGLTWEEWRAYLTGLISSAPDGPETVAGVLYGKEMWPGARALLEKAYAREKRLENRLSIAERLLRNYADRRVVGVACQALADEAVRTSALATLESVCDQLTDKEAQLVGSALDGVAAKLSGTEAVMAGSIYWKLDHHGKRAVPMLFAGLSEDYRLLETLPVDETARLIEPSQVVILGEYLESLAIAENIDKDRLHAVCEVVVAAYPKTTPLLPVLTRLSESKNVLVAECIGGALEQIRK